MDLDRLSAWLRLEHPPWTKCAPYSACLGTGQPQWRDTQGKHLDFGREGGFISLENECCTHLNLIITAWPPNATLTSLPADNWVKISKALRSYREILLLSLTHQYFTYAENKNVHMELKNSSTWNNRGIAVDPTSSTCAENSFGFRSFPSSYTGTKQLCLIM